MSCQQVVKENNFFVELKRSKPLREAKKNNITRTKNKQNQNQQLLTGRQEKREVMAIKEKKAQNSKRRTEV